MTAKDSSFGDVAVQLGFTTLERVDECMREQEAVAKAGRTAAMLGELMVNKGYLTKEQVIQIMKHQAKANAAMFVGGFRVMSQIGQGAMGVIYKAVQVSLDRTVALKILAEKFAQNERLRDRFLKEARTVAKLNHPNIVQGIDVGVQGSTYYFAMEFIDGPTVGDLLKRGGALDERRAINVITQVSRALDHAYGHGIIHRDIKPDNIMLTRDGVAKLCDLGLARMLSGDEQEESRKGAAMGTPHYISPEQARGDPSVDTRSDIYSLGATFYHMVVGEPPYPGGNAIQVIARHLSEPLTPPRKRNALVSEGVDFIITKMMNKLAELRYQTPQELLTDLESVSKGGSPAGMIKIIEDAPTAPRVVRKLRRRGSALRRLRGR